MTCPRCRLPLRRPDQAPHAAAGPHALDDCITALAEALQVTRIALASADRRIRDLEMIRTVDEIDN